MDEHVQGAVTNGLKVRSVDVLTVQEDGRSAAEDREVLERAVALGRSVYTQDKHFLAEAAAWQKESKMFLGIIFSARGEIEIRQAVDDLELIAKAGSGDEFVNRVQYLPLR
jgi:predicted nuclease of predicted toxin-antitoxin system